MSHSQKDNFKIIAKTLFGLEHVLAKEIKALGGTQIELLKRAVQFDGNKALLYKLNLRLRTALRLLVPIQTFNANSDQELYKKIKRVDWSKYLSPDDTLAIDAVTYSDIFRHSHYAALKTKDAIADFFREKTGSRPSVDLQRPSLRINLHISDTVCNLSLDSSGFSLNQRGYRVDGGRAPLNEVLAAGMILLTGWEADSHFIDPMCGSGTLPIEAALIAYNIPPHRFDTHFGFKNWPDFDQDLWENVWDQAQEAQRDFSFSIRGSDQSFPAIKNAQRNVLAAHLEGKVHIERQKLSRVEPPPPPGLLITNPPYDERIEEDEITDLYRFMGDKFKNDFSGYNAWIISSNKEALKAVGLRASKKYNLLNGNLECKYQGYELYKGTKKKNKEGN